MCESRRCRWLLLPRQWRRRQRQQRRQLFVACHNNKCSVFHSIDSFVLLHGIFVFIYANFIVIYSLKLGRASFYFDSYTLTHTRTQYKHAHSCTHDTRTHIHTLVSFFYTFLITIWLALCTFTNAYFVQLNNDHCKYILHMLCPRFSCLFCFNLIHTRFF